MLKPEWMVRLALILSVLVAALLYGAGPVGAQSEPTRIEFAAGASSATVNGEIAAQGVNSYILRAGAGQKMRLALTASPGDVYLAVSGAYDGAQLLEMSAQATSWEGVLPADQDYRIYVAAANVGGAYTLQVEIPPLGEQPTPTPAPTETPAPAPTETPTPSPTPVPGKTMYLTFDDGPNPTWTPQVLALLARYNAHATFFVVGSNVANFPNLVTAELDSGHVVGNHTYSHRSLVGLSKRAWDNEVVTTKNLIGPRGGPYLRPPYGAVDSNTRTWAAELGYNIALWNIDPRDWALPGVDAIVNNVLANAHDGGIVIMHDGGGTTRTQTLAALEQIIPALQQRGYRLAGLGQ